MTSYRLIIMTCIDIFLCIVDLLIGEGAKQARDYQWCTNSSWCGIYMYGGMYGGTYAIIVAHATHT